MLDSEEENMIATCHRLRERLSVRDGVFLSKLQADPAITDPTKYIAHADGEKLRAMWDRCTNNGTDEG